MVRSLSGDRRIQGNKLQGIAQFQTDAAKKHPLPTFSLLHHILSLCHQNIPHIYWPNPHVTVPG